MVIFFREEVEVSDPDRASSLCPGGGEAPTQTYAGDHSSNLLIVNLQEFCTGTANAIFELLQELIPLFKAEKANE